MTENDLRQQFIRVAKSFLGWSEADGRHKQIVDIYNSQKPLPVGYKVTYTDEWCATYVSAMAVRAGFTDIIPPECSCPRQIELFKKMNRWVEDDTYVPKPGDIIYYNWSDDWSTYAKTDNTKVAQHVGIVCDVNAAKQITVIEGNYSKSVKYRYLTVNGIYVRGYASPDYAGKAAKLSLDRNTVQYIVKPAEMSIYVNQKKLITSKVKDVTGCDAIENGGLYNGDWTACCFLKANGIVYATDIYGYWGLAWNTVDDITMAESKDMGKYENYIACVCMVRDFKMESMIYDPKIGGARQRSAIGVLGDGSIWMYMTTNGTTPEQLQQIALSAGCKHALMLDGGASTQCITPNGTLVSTTRPIVQNYICLFNKKVATPVVSSTDIPPETLRKGMIGASVLWLQTNLNKVGFHLDEDGDFGNNTLNAVKEFQKRMGLAVDGVVGPATKEVLARAAKGAVVEKPVCPYTEPTIDIRKGSIDRAGETAVHWVQWMLNQHGATLVVDGDFGSLSEAALLKFQMNSHIAMSGVCDATTRTMLKK